MKRSSITIDKQKKNASSFYLNFEFEKKEEKMKNRDLRSKTLF